MRRLALLLLALVSAACGPSKSAAEVDWTPEPVAKDKRLRETEALFGPPQPLDAKEGKQTAWLGVRHDLMLSKAPHEVRCTCLAVEVGPPNDAKFFWMGSSPDVGDNALAVAIDARGVSCPSGDPDDRRRRPSISAVDVEGEDVVVEVEDLPLGRPLASGAIIPKPGPKGSVYVKPRRGGGFYGSSVGGAGRCRVR
jgi:hypothetical protein